MKLLRFVFLLLVCLIQTVYSSEKQAEIQADRRMLVRVRNSIITFADVMKKMDFIFYQQFPQLRTVPKERLKFYEANWKHVLQDLIERRLIMIFAEENHMEVQHGDIREELEGIFGPNVLLALYDAKVPVDDAHEMVRQEIMMRRILSFYVKAAVLASVTPQRVKERYRVKYENMALQEKISWRILALKAPAEVDSQQLVNKLIFSLNEGKSTFEEEKAALPENCELTISPLFVTESSQIAAGLKPILDAAEKNIWTAPLQSKDMKNGIVKWNSYLVQERTQGEKIPLSAVEDEIREELVGPVLEERKRVFVNDLLKKYDVIFTMSEKEMETYKPFSLQ